MAGNGDGWNRKTISNVTNTQAGQLNRQQAPQPRHARNQRQQLRANAPQLPINGLPAAANHGNSNSRIPLQGRRDLQDALRNTTGFMYGLGGHAPGQGARTGTFNSSSRLHGRHFQRERTTGLAFGPFSAAGRSSVAPQVDGNGNVNFMSIPTNNLSRARNIHPSLGANFNRGQTSSGFSVEEDFTLPLGIPNSRGPLRLAPGQPIPPSVLNALVESIRSGAEAQAFANSLLQPFPNVSASAPQLPSRWDDTGRLRVRMTTLPPNAVDGTHAARVNPVPALANLQQARALRAMLSPMGDAHARVRPEELQSGLMTGNGVQGGFNGAHPSTFYAPPLGIIPNSRDEIAVPNTLLRTLLNFRQFDTELRNLFAFQELRNLRDLVENQFTLSAFGLDADSAVISSGLNQDTITADLRGQVYDSETTPVMDKICCICLEEYVDGDYVSKLECGHAFHYDCIGKWLRERNNCPICKRIAIREHEDEDEDDDDDDDENEDEDSE